MKELKNLDDVLKQLNEKTKDQPLKKEDILWYADKLFNSSFRDRRTIMEKLIKDGYASSLIHENEEKYFITFEGLLFLKKGGYTKQQKIKNLEIIANWLNIIVIIIGTIIAAIYAIHEILCH